MLQKWNHYKMSFTEEEKVRRALNRGSGEMPWHGGADVFNRAFTIASYFFNERLQLRYLYYPSSMKETPAGWEKTRFMGKEEQYQSERL